MSLPFPFLTTRFDSRPARTTGIGRLGFLVVALLVGLPWVTSACSDDSPGTGDEDTSALDGSTELGDLGPADTLPVPCDPGETACWEGRLATCLSTGSAWLVESCRPDQSCIEGECRSVECQPGERDCQDNAIITCDADGTGWSEPQECGAEESCVSGVCTPDSCVEGDKLCGTDRVFICEEGGDGWTEEICPDGWTCFGGECVECIRDTECDDDEICEDGICQSLALSIVTTLLPDGMVGQDYQARLAAVGGDGPYTWAILSGQPPTGLDLDTSGEISGEPTTQGDSTFQVRVTDAESATASRELSIQVHGQGLLITTESLPNAQEGMEYSALLEALGGTSPYAWMVAAGALPDGILLTSTGALTGIPTEIGDFTATFRVFDSTLPPALAEKELVLTVDIAPLVIVGDQEYNLMLTKIIVLPLMTLIEGIPIPYETVLQARGGLRPYHWSESELADILRYLIPQSGIPDGLVLDEDGTLSGTVTSTDQVVSITIPTTQITLNGFFFMGSVEDSQSSPDQASALFHIPTLGL